MVSSEPNRNKRAIVLGGGASGLVAARELIDAGIEDVLILERGETLGGIWAGKCWDSLTLSSSKWGTEFGSYPMPDHYPDFLTSEHMFEYLHRYADAFSLTERLRLGVHVREVKRRDDGRFDVHTDEDLYEDIDYVVLCVGANGRPHIPDYPGLSEFEGRVVHSAQYKEPSEYHGKRVLCIGLGESGVGISAEIASVAARTIVSATTYSPAPRVQPYSSTPFEQMMVWPIGRWMKDYQESLTLEVSWYQRLPSWLKPWFVRRHPVLELFPEPWLPKAWVPYNWHSKFWPKPGEGFGDVSGNLTRPEVPTDDILYLVHRGQIVAKGAVARFGRNDVEFEDGTREEIDEVVVNAGYRPASLSMTLPDGWSYRYRDLYKGCFHPDMTGFAVVGSVRPTMGSVPAMAEMQARLVAGVFAGKVSLPSPNVLRRRIDRELDQHLRTCPAMGERFAHVHFFDRWMEEVAELVGCRPRWWDFLGSWRHVQAYWLGAPMSLRFRLRGPGAVAGGVERYSRRVARVFDTAYGLDLRLITVARFLYPHLLAGLVFGALVALTSLGTLASVFVAIVFWILYMTVDLFRFACSVPFLWVVLQRTATFLPEYTSNPRLPKSYKKDIPDYRRPAIFQVDEEPPSRGGDTAEATRPESESLVNLTPPSGLS